MSSEQHEGRFEGKNHAESQPILLESSLKLTCPCISGINNSALNANETETRNCLLVNVPQTKTNFETQNIPTCSPNSGCATKIQLLPACRRERMECFHLHRLNIGNRFRRKRLSLVRVQSDPSLLHSAASQDDNGDPCYTRELALTQNIPHTEATGQMKRPNLKTFIDQVGHFTLPIRKSDSTGHWARSIEALGDEIKRTGCSDLAGSNPFLQKRALDLGCRIDGRDPDFNHSQCIAHDRRGPDYCVCSPELNKVYCGTRSRKRGGPGDKALTGRKSRSPHLGSEFKMVGDQDGQNKPVRSRISCDFNDRVTKRSEKRLFIPQLTRQLGDLEICEYPPPKVECSPIFKQSSTKSVNPSPSPNGRKRVWRRSKSSFSTYPRRLTLTGKFFLPKMSQHSSQTERLARNPGNLRDEMTIKMSNGEMVGRTDMRKHKKSIDTVKADIPCLMANSSGEIQPKIANKSKVQNVSTAAPLRPNETSPRFAAHRKTVKTVSQLTDQDTFIPFKDKISMKNPPKERPIKGPNPKCGLENLQSCVLDTTVNDNTMSKRGHPSEHHICRDLNTPVQHQKAQSHLMEHKATPRCMDAGEVIHGTENQIDLDIEVQRKNTPKDNSISETNIGMLIQTRVYRWIESNSNMEQDEISPAEKRAAVDEMIEQCGDLFSALDQAEAKLILHERSKHHQVAKVSLPEGGTLPLYTSSFMKPMVLAAEFKNQEVVTPKKFCGANWIGNPIGYWRRRSSTKRNRSIGFERRLGDLSSNDMEATTPSDFVHLFTKDKTSNGTIKDQDSGQDCTPSIGCFGKESDTGNVAKSHQLKTLVQGSGMPGEIGKDTEFVPIPIEQSTLAPYKFTQWFMKRHAPKTKSLDRCEVGEK